MNLSRTLMLALVPALLPVACVGTADEVATEPENEPIALASSKLDPNAPAQPAALPHGTLDLRVEPSPNGAGGTGGATWFATQAPVFVNIPRMSASFVAEEDNTNLAVTFSAEASTSVSNKRMFIRALVDGQVADPADIVFTEGSFSGARSFTFTHVVGKGIHTVEMQWLVDEGASASLRAASLVLRHGTETSSDGTLTTHTAPSGPEVRTTDAFWQGVPDMTIPFFLPAGAEPIVNFSAETYVGGKRMFVRALIDGVPLSPGDVVFAQRSSRQTHRMSFGGSPTLTPGWHTASIEWLVDAGGSALVGDRTITVSAFPDTSAMRHDLIIAPSGPSVSKNDSSWSQVPNLSKLVTVPPNGELEVGFTGEVTTSTNAVLEMRLVANGVPSNETAVITQQAYPSEVQSFTFDSKHLFLRPNTFTGVWLEWRVLGGTAWMGDRTMELVSEKGLVPDLAEAPEIGVGNVPVEAAIGTRKVLTIIHRIPRAAPNDTIPTVAQVTDALFGARGAADYYAKVSGGRFGLENAGVLEYDALKSENHYWNHAPFGCDTQQSDGFAGGHAERWAEAISLANANIDFASFDRDKDGTVSPNELAVLIIAPQASADGFTRELSPYCNGAPFTVDGVIVPEISEWFTSSPASNWEVPTHELAHLILDLSDLYANGWNFDTEVGKLSLMGDNFGTSSHIDPMNKLALGWVTPLYTPTVAKYSIEDVKQSGEVIVLPREADGDGKEFFLLENRQNGANNPLYDDTTGASGIIAWHIVEDPAQSQEPPACMVQTQWASVSGNARRGLRVMRPGISFASGGPSSWDAADGDLLDNGLVCPGGAPPVQNALLWADGNASGYGMTNISASGSVMDFIVDLP